MAAGKYPDRARVLLAALPLRTALVAALLSVAVFAIGAPPTAAHAQTGGTVAAWGDNDFGQGTVPAGLIGVRAIDAGQTHSMALKDDGTVIAWGNNGDGQGTVPAGLSSATAISGGDYHSLAIGDVSSPPVAVDDLYDVDEDDTLNVVAPGVLDNDTDANSDPLTAGVADDAQHGTLTLNTDGSFTYAPNANFNGSDSFTYAANDGTANSANAATVSIAVAAVNDAPVAEDDSTTTDEDAATNMNVTTNDTDVDNTNADLGVSSVAQPSNGTVNKNADGTITYVPDRDFNGTDSFTYEVCDEGDPALCDSVTVTMTVSPVPDACTIKGTGKDDVLRGTDRRDVICGGGNDTVYGRGANDLIMGGVGNDTAHGDAGDDTLLGGDGRDRLYGDEGDDRLYGGAGTDLLNGGSGVNFTQQ